MIAVYREVLLPGSSRLPREICIGDLERDRTEACEIDSLGVPPPIGETSLFLEVDFLTEVFKVSRKKGDLEARFLTVDCLDWGPGVVTADEFIADLMISL